LNEGFLPPFGDPTVDTSYTFCPYDLQEPAGGIVNVRYERVFPAGAPWQSKQQRWEFEASDANGTLNLRVNNRARLVLVGDMAALPGPLDGTRYFGSMAVGLIAGRRRCFLHRAGGIWWTPKENTASSFRLNAHAYMND